MSEYCDLSVRFLVPDIYREKEYAFLIDIEKIANLTEKQIEWLCAINLRIADKIVVTKLPSNQVAFGDNMWNQQDWNMWNQQNEKKIELFDFWNKIIK